MQKEIWKDVPEYENLYQVSNLGNVKSKTGRLRKPQKNSFGYWYLLLSKNSKNYGIRIHQLVAMAFLGHKRGEKYLVVDHIDNDKNNNNLNNLQIITHRENIYKDTKNKNSKYIGVTKSWNKWRAIISINNKSKHLGYFKTELEAAKAYQDKLKELNEN